MNISIVGEYATSILAVLTLTGVLFRFIVLLPLKAYIKDLTYPIQPTANGGKSLPDIAKNVERIHDRLDEVEKRLDTLEK